MSTTFDESRSYKPWEGPGMHFNDGREVDLLRFIFAHPNLEGMRGRPEAILEAIDQFGRTFKFLMNVGEYKGKIVTDLMGFTQPKIMVELGGYMGYSCLKFGAELRKIGGSQYFSLEKDPLFAAISTTLVNLAKLQDIVQVIISPSHESLRRLHDQGVLKHIDLLFIDHHKPAYVPDLKLCEELGLVKPGSTVAADNVIWPGNTPYIDYVRASPKERREKLENPTNVNLSDHYFQAIIDQQKDMKRNTEARGDPDLVYQSNIYMSFEPHGVEDGVEISACVAKEDVNGIISMEQKDMKGRSFVTSDQVEGAHG